MRRALPFDAGAPATAQAFVEAFGVSRETGDRLRTYEALLNRWQKTINLVAPRTLATVWSRHFADSAQLLDLAPAGATRWLDLGSGAGFPGLVLAIMLMERPPCRVLLVESDSRKAAFLSEVARRTGAPVDILCMRIESPSTQAKVGEVDVITARALAPMTRLLGLAAPFFSPTTVALFLKGREVVDEINEAKADWTFRADLVESRTDHEGRVAVITSLKANDAGVIP